jgi:uncharacterized protein (DUF2267 family)
MSRDELLDTVAQAAGIKRDDAERAVRAALRTLGERITRGLAEDIATSLPHDLRELLVSAPEPAERFDLEEFVQRVADREGVDVATAYRDLQGVFVALGRAVPPGELDDLAAQLPKDYGPLIESAWRQSDPPPAGEPLVERVTELTGLEPPRARRALEAVLETLAVRISEGEVEDLMRRLPGELADPLQRGLAQNRKATRIPLEEFLDRVADREGVGRGEAEDHTRAVFAALSEYVPGDELHDVESELPREYARLFSEAA